LSISNNQQIFKIDFVQNYCLYFSYNNGIIITEREVMTMYRWKKEVILNNRKFKIVFWEDRENIFWCEVYEIVRPKKFFFDFLYQHIFISTFGVRGSSKINIISLALDKTKEEIEKQESIQMMEKMLDEYCQE
jgi:hypothetical protein